MKSDERRSAILDQLADYVLAEGLAAASLRPLAAAAGLSDRMLLYYFKDKQEVIGAVLERIALRLTSRLNSAVHPEPLPYDELRRRLPRVVLADELWPYLRLWLEIAAMAARNEPVFRAVGEQIARGFLLWAEGQLDSATPAARKTDAVRLMIQIEGMALLKGVGLEEECLGTL
jgi:AcrR family transcriptional regulator